MSKPVLPQFERRLAGAAATAALAARLAGQLRAGDVIALHGAIGAGKTTFARGLIAALGGGDEVPSPTFTLVQIYEVAPAPVWHFDLYRLGAAEEVLELGLDEALGQAIAVIEWPERLGPYLPADRLDVMLDFVDGAAEVRAVRLIGVGVWAERLVGLRWIVEDA